MKCFLKIRKLKIENSPKFRGGYSLIEILVVLALMGIVMALGLAGWTNYRDNRTLDEAGLELVSQIHSLRSKAISGKKSNNVDCPSLVGYQVDGNLDAFVCCRDGGGETCTKIKSLPVEATVENTSGLPVKFLSGGGWVADNATIELSYHGKQGAVTISQKGASIKWERNP